MLLTFRFFTAELVLGVLMLFHQMDLLPARRWLVLELDLVPIPPRVQWNPVWRQLPRVLLSLASDQDIRGWDLRDGGQWLGRGQPGLPALLLQ